MPTLTSADVAAALTQVLDPEIRRPITDLDMVEAIEVADDGAVHITIRLTTAGCPLRDTLTRDVTAAVAKLDGAGEVSVSMTVMTPEQREALREKLRGGPEPVIPFNEPGNLTRIIAVASGKGGVGKSSITANLAVALAWQGLKVGVVDADVYGFSIPRMIGADGDPTQLDDMILPVVASDVKVISMGMLVPPGRPVVWRGPILHRAIQQFLTDVFWGDLDYLLIDMPPGTGDVPLSVAQLLPNSELLIVTTPQPAAAEVAQRAGAMAVQTKQRVIGVVENMAWLDQGDGTRLELFGAGGGAALAKNLTDALGYDVPLAAQVPIDMNLREGSDAGLPVTIARPGSPAAKAIVGLAEQIAASGRGLAGRKLPVSFS